MGNSWTRLLQEASKHGGPNGLRQHYANLGANATRGNGRLSGFFIGAGTLVVGAGIGWAADKAMSGAFKRKEAPQTVTTPAAAPEPGPEDGADEGPSKPHPDVA